MVLERERERETHILQSKDPSVFGAQGTEPINVCPVQQCTFLCGELNCVHNMIFSKHSGIFTLGNSHPLIVTLYLLWRSMMVLKIKKNSKNAKMNCTQLSDKCRCTQILNLFTCYMDTETALHRYLLHDTETALLHGY